MQKSQFMRESVSVPITKDTPRSLEKREVTQLAPDVGCSRYFDPFTFSILEKLSGRLGVAVLTAQACGDPACIAVGCGRPQGFLPMSTFAQSRHV